MITQENVYGEYNSKTRILTISDQTIDIKENSRILQINSFKTEVEDIEFYKCNFGCLEFIKDNHKLQTVYFCHCEFSNLSLVKFLNQDTFLNLSNLCLENCNIYNIETLIHCLVNIENIRNIDLRNNQIRSIKSIIKLKSEECAIFISQNTEVAECLQRDNSYIPPRRYTIYNYKLKSKHFSRKEYRNEQMRRQLKYTEPTKRNLIIDPESFQRTNLNILDLLLHKHYAKIKTRKDYNY